MTDAVGIHACCRPSRLARAWVKIDGERCVSFRDPDHGREGRIEGHRARVEREEPPGELGAIRARSRKEG